MCSTLRVFKLGGPPSGDLRRHLTVTGAAENEPKATETAPISQKAFSIRFNSNSPCILHEEKDEHKPVLLKS